VIQIQRELKDNPDYEDFYEIIPKKRLKLLKRFLYNSFTKTKDRDNTYPQIMEENPTWTANDFVEKYLMTNLNTDYRNLEQNREPEVFYCEYCDFKSEKMYLFKKHLRIDHNNS
jgi:hypothetical protein